MEPQALADFDEASRRVGDKHMEVMKGQAVVWPAVSFIAESGIILMVAFGAYWALNGRLSPCTVIAFLVAWGFLFDPISRINPLSQTFTKGLVSAKRLFAIIDTPDEANLTEGKLPESLSGKIEFRDVTFSYGGDVPALKGINLTALPGQTIALVGATGSGKSTLLNLLSRFYEPSSGEILLDGVLISEISKEWLRDNTGFVTQEPFLFNTSLRENLTLAKYEATSALDNTTEDLVQQALDQLRAHRTSFVIAHRLSTIRNADLICVLHHGELVEHGTHRELIEKNGHYAKLERAGKTGS